MLRAGGDGVGHRQSGGEKLEGGFGMHGWFGEEGDEGEGCGAEAEAEAEAEDRPWIGGRDKGRFGEVLMDE